MFGRVLSIQSHVVHGYVGNKSAVFPLQLLGFEVDPVHSVQFSNHTGYAKGWTGDALNGAQLDALVEGLKRNDVVRLYTHLLTGYIGSVSFLRSVLQVHATLKAQCPELVYFCDPVLGDKGKLYVKPELVEVYKQEVVPVASVLTPNQFELEMLTDSKVTDISSAMRAFGALHARGVRTVVLTSCEFEGQGEDALLLLASIARPGAAPRLIQAAQPRVEGHYTGTGDLIAALLLAWTTRKSDDMELAILRACTTMNAVVSRTRETIVAGENPHGELCLIQSRFAIERPDEIVDSPIDVFEIDPPS